MEPEEWRIVREFPNYQISNKGRVFNSKRNQHMRTSVTPFGHVKITLTDYDGSRHTRSVAQLVADMFVPHPNYMCDHLMVLDGDLLHVEASNLAWRPRWFAWKYTRQLKVPQPRQYHNLAVRNVTTGDEYESIIHAGMTEGLLFENIWRSTYTRQETYPHGSVFEIIERV